MLGTLSWRERWDRGLQYSHIFALYYVMSQEYDMIAVVWLQLATYFPKVVHTYPYILPRVLKCLTLHHDPIIETRISTATAVSKVLLVKARHIGSGATSLETTAGKCAIILHKPWDPPILGWKCLSQRPMVFYVFWRLTGSTTFFWR